MKTVLKIFFVVLSLLLYKGGISADPLSILASNEPPLNFINENGILTGISVDIINEIQRRVANDDPVQIYPWVRLYDRAENEPNIVAFTMARTEDREDKFHWISLVNRNAWMLLARKDSGIEISEVEDAMKVNAIGVIRGGGREKLLLDLGFNNLEPVTNYEQNIRKLLNNRISLVFYAYSGAVRTCRDIGIDFHDELEVVNTVYISQAYIVMSKGTAMTTVEQWQDAAQQMKNDGTFDQILNKWKEYLYNHEGLETHIQDGALNLWKSSY